MIWVKDTQNERAMHLTENSVIVGTICFIENNKRWMATLNELYLGTYMTCENAQKAVEAKWQAKQKSGGRIIL